MQNAKDVPRVPIDAVFRQGDDWTVLVERNSRARLTPIEISERNANWAHVVQGLEEKDVVILYPRTGLQMGQCRTPKN